LYIDFLLKYDKNCNKILKAFPIFQNELLRHLVIWLNIYGTRGLSLWLAFFKRQQSLLLFSSLLHRFHNPSRQPCKRKWKSYRELADKFVSGWVNRAKGGVSVDNFTRKYTGCLRCLLMV
jgi:hypothetical protein